jgi:acetyl esterase/lipase
MHKDGRTVESKTSIEPARPTATINRRDFLKAAAAFGIAAPSAMTILAACTSAETAPPSGSSSSATSSSATSAGGGAADASASGSTDASASTGSLVFPTGTFTTQTATITGADGVSHQVTSHLYSALTYVAKPVDATYQSLNVQVPVQIDGKDVDASNAPIVFNIPVGGYMSASVSGGSGGGAPGGTPPSGNAPSGQGAPNGGAPGGGSSGAGNTDLALAAGYVVVTAGARGRDNQAADGTYYGKAPAAIVDLKAAIRYIRSNKGVIPGNTDQIVSAGVSAGGALSTLLGASGDSDLYSADLKALGAADASDAIFGVAAYCPITDLEHADAIYEWSFGSLGAHGGSVDTTISTALAAEFADYEVSLNLKTAGGALTADTAGEYLVSAFLEPAATTYLAALSDADRASYLSSNPGITWSNGKATLTWAAFVAHLGNRKKSAPAFDALDLSAAENSEFGNAKTAARHFTEYSAKQSGGTLEADIPGLVNQMNPMYFLANGNAGAVKHWFLRVGTSDTDTSPLILGNLAASASAKGGDVDAVMYWDAGHGVNNDPAAFVAWVAKRTGYAK